MNFLARFIKNNNMRYRMCSNSQVFTFELGYFTDVDPTSDRYDQDEKRVAGFSFDKDKSEVKYLYVKPEYQVNGLSRLMLEHVIELGVI